MIKDEFIRAGDQICFCESKKEILFLRKGVPVQLPKIDLDILDELSYYQDSILDILKLVSDIFRLIPVTDKKQIQKGIKSYTLI